MELISTIMTTVISSIAISTSAAVSFSSRNKARKEIYKRKLLEQKYNYAKSAYIAKERALQYSIESKNSQIDSLNSKIVALKTRYTELEEVSKLEGQSTKYLIDAKNNKIEAQNSKITMLQADCTRLQEQIKEMEKSSKKQG